jgi:hypothetical protein
MDSHIAKGFLVSKATTSGADSNAPLYSLAERPNPFAKGRREVSVIL